MKGRLHSSDGVCLRLAGQLFDNQNLHNLSVFDVGANVGLFAKRIQLEWSRFGLAITCFEPNVEARKELLINLESAEDFEPQVVGLALSNSSGSRALYFPKKKSVLGSFIERQVFEEYTDKWGEIQKQITEVTTLDTYVLDQDVKRIDYLKVDTEGTELKVLQGAKNCLEGQIISCGQFEYGGTFKDAGISLGDCVEFLSKVGYSTIDVQKKQVLTSKIDDDYLLNNLFFCRDTFLDSIMTGL